MIYLTGDTHGVFNRIKNFCENMNTTYDDVLIILGDAGINGNVKYVSEDRKEFISKLPITLFCIHGNHERRPYTISSYKTKGWNGATVYWEEEYPNILFAKDGEIYDLDGITAIAIGGAYSIDKYIRIAGGYGWWGDEQPSEEIKEYVEEQLEKNNWKVDLVLSHTCPKKYEPIECFLGGFDQSTVDKSTEEWLDIIEDRLEYKRWFCGHFHTQKRIDKMIFMFEDYEVIS